MAKKKLTDHEKELLQYKDAAGKMNLAALKKIYRQLRLAKSPDEHEKMLCVWDEILSTVNCQNDPALAAFYNWCTNQAIDEIRAYDDKTPRLWKFYSSGVIIKANGIIRAFDLNCGCEMEYARTRLRLTQANIRKLSNIIDEYYATHAHVDHIGTQLVDALVKNKKKIIANSDTIRKWLLTTALDSDKLQKPDLYVFPSFQRAGTQNLPNSAFVLKLTKDCTILVKGDIYTGTDITALCNWIKKQNLMIDYAIVSIFGLTDPRIIPEVKRRFNSTVIPTHEWEFGHRVWNTSGRATQTFADLYAEIRKYKCTGFPLMWGESVELASNKRKA